MKFENTFEVDAPVDEVFQTILDVENVAPSVPGAKVTEKTADNAYKVAIKVKLGPMTMTYKGDVEVVEGAGPPRGGRCWREGSRAARAPPTRSRHGIVGRRQQRPARSSPTSR